MRRPKRSQTQCAESPERDFRVSPQAADSLSGKLNLPTKAPHSFDGLAVAQNIWSPGFLFQRRQAFMIVIGTLQTSSVIDYLMTTPST